MGTVPCTGEADCPMCQMFGPPTKKKMSVNVIDRQDGTIKPLIVDKAKFDKWIEKTIPKGFCLRLRVWRFEVRFWWMWRKLSWKEKRSGTNADCSFAMYGPWEFRRYWR